MTSPRRTWASRTTAASTSQTSLSLRTACMFRRTCSMRATRVSSRSDGTSAWRILPPALAHRVGGSTPTCRVVRSGSPKALPARRCGSRRSRARPACASSPTTRCPRSSPTWCARSLRLPVRSPARRGLTVATGPAVPSVASVAPTPRPSRSASWSHRMRTGRRGRTPTRASRASAGRTAP